MIDFIIRESKKIMYDCCERHSKQKGLKVENVQLILGLDEKRKILFLNAVAEKLLGLKEVDIIGKYVEKLLLTGQKAPARSEAEGINPGFLAKHGFY